MRVAVPPKSNHYVAHHSTLPATIGAPPMCISLPAPRPWNPCVACATTAADSDTYVIDFPAKSNPVQRACIVAAAALIDYRMFETQKKGVLNSD